jgi:hypothetical protein
MRSLQDRLQRRLRLGIVLDKGAGTTGAILLLMLWRLLLLIGSRAIADQLLELRFDLSRRELVWHSRRSREGWRRSLEANVVLLRRGRCSDKVLLLLLLCPWSTVERRGVVRIIVVLHYWRSGIDLVQNKHILARRLV